MHRRAAQALENQRTFAARTDGRGADGGTRTHTSKAQGILSPRRLPFRHVRIGVGLTGASEGMPPPPTMSALREIEPDGPSLIYASIPDPELVQKAMAAGVGGHVEGVAGARVDGRYAPPVPLKGIVEAIAPTGSTGR